mmetsp:Transcript_44708/g.111178  ORF Transcript_44708/g.111178 Transcript_44708/m.111178 type:complete len:253 (-) Transcript_44708:846-1604(-)
MSDRNGMRLITWSSCTHGASRNLSKNGDRTSANDKALRLLCSSAISNGVKELHRRAWPCRHWELTKSIPRAMTHGIHPGLSPPWLSRKEWSSGRRWNRASPNTNPRRDGSAACLAMSLIAIHWSNNTFRSASLTKYRPRRPNASSPTSTWSPSSPSPPPAAHAAHGHSRYDDDVREASLPRTPTGTNLPFLSPSCVGLLGGGSTSGDWEGDALVLLDGSLSCLCVAPGAAVALSVDAVVVLLAMLLVSPSPS